MAVGERIAIKRPVSDRAVVEIVVKERLETGSTIPNPLGRVNTVTGNFNPIDLKEQVAKVANELGIAVPGYVNKALSSAEEPVSGLSDVG